MGNLLSYTAIMNKNFFFTTYWKALYLPPSKAFVVVVLPALSSPRIANVTDLFTKKNKQQMSEFEQPPQIHLYSLPEVHVNHVI